MTRVDNARTAFLKNNIAQIKNTHSKKAIHESLHYGEAHKKAFNLPEIILGGQDGLVNVLGIILGVSAASASNQLVIVAGLAAAFAESISMAAVFYTSTIAQADYYQSEYEREKWEIEHVPEGEKEEIKALYENFGFRGKVLNEVVGKITSNKEVWLRIMMEQELKLEPVERKTAVTGAFIVGVSAIIGSFIPLTPFFFLQIKSATILSLIVSSLALFIVGFYKAKKTLGRNFVKAGIEMMIIGMVSAFVGYLVGLLFKVKSPL